MPNCSIIGCGIKKSRKRPNLTLHRLPKNNSRKKMWVDIIGVENLKPHTKSVYICSLHFDESCFNRTLNKTVLRDEALPSRIISGHPSSEKHFSVFPRLYLEITNMTKCSVKQCGARKTKNQPILTFHSFPANECLKKKWLEILGTENINHQTTKTQFVCSMHFDETSFNRTLDVVRLHDGAVPSSSLLSVRVGAESSDTESCVSYEQGISKELEDYTPNEHKQTDTQEPSPIEMVISTDQIKSEFEEEENYVTIEQSSEEDEEEMTKVEKEERRKRKVAQATLGIENVFHKTQYLPCVTWSHDLREQLYDFGYYIAEILMCFDQNDVAEAQAEIVKVLKKIRVKYMSNSDMPEPCCTKEQAGAARNHRKRTISDRMQSGIRPLVVETIDIQPPVTQSRITHEHLATKSNLGAKTSGKLVKAPSAKQVKVILVNNEVPKSELQSVVNSSSNSHSLVSKNVKASTPKQPLVVLRSQRLKRQMKEQTTFESVEVVSIPGSSEIDPLEIPLTQSKSKQCFTEVRVSSGHLQSKSHGSKSSNLNTIPND